MLAGRQAGDDGRPAAAPDAEQFARLDAAARRYALVEQVARLAVSFARWKDDQRCEGIGYEQLRVLQAVRCWGSAIMREIGEQLWLTPRNMTAIVDALVEGGLVARRPHPSDRRATLIELTPEGEKIAAESIPPTFEEMGHVFDGFSPDEQEQFHELLGRLIAEMRTGGPCGGACE
jgi:DNA-binding MarR family transcriptional regulator